MTLCVYAITGRRAPRLSVTGVAGERLRSITEGTLTAIVGELARPFRASADSLRRYDGTLRALAARLPALLPARFGTCFDNPDELAFVLRSRRSSLNRALAHVRNRAQMTVRIVGGRGAGERGVPETASGAAAVRNTATTGAAYLRDRAAAAAAERDVPGFDSVREAVSRFIRDERVEKRAGVATVYHLVPRGSVVAYRRAVERAAAAAGLQIIVSGPWPPYAFAAW